MKKRKVTILNKWKKERSTHPATELWLKYEKRSYHNPRFLSQVGWERERERERSMIQWDEKVK